MQCTSSDLHVAIYSSNIDVIKTCVKNKNIINSFWRGCTPVSSAIYLNRHEILEILVNNGANVNLMSRNNKMEPPLFAACRLQDKTAINILLNAPSLDINQRDFFGRTALWAAARYCKLDIVELLLSRGADLNCRLCIRHPVLGAIAQNWATSRGIIHTFIRRGCLLCADSFNNLLKWAVKHADRESFSLLISAGCSVNSYQDWLTVDHLPPAWQKDKSFCNWISSLNGNPASLLNLTAFLIRNMLIKKWSILSLHHVEKLNLPDSLNNLLLLKT